MKLVIYRIMATVTLSVTWTRAIPLSMHQNPNGLDEQLVISTIQHKVAVSQVPDTNGKGSKDSWLDNIENALDEAVNQVVQSQFEDANANEQTDLMGETVTITDPQKAGLIIDTRYGKIEGKILKQWDRVRMFLGVPYAAAPIGKLRWTAPQRPQSWSGIRTVKNIGKSCPQLVPFEIQSEDCLHINMYVPTVDRLKAVNGSLSKLPVMVWMHGGAWIVGSGRMMGIQDPSYVVQHKLVIVIAVNYRLGPLGFLVTPGENGLRGNYGLLDQRMALQWIQENIDAFNGDPNKVTIWGESAGAMSIGFHLTAPNSYGLYQRAILQSNVLGVHYRNRTQSADIGKLFASKLNCLREPNSGIFSFLRGWMDSWTGAQTSSPQEEDATVDLDCLRSKSVLEIMYLRWPIAPQNQDRVAGHVLLWAPTLDDPTDPMNQQTGADFQHHPYRQLMAGQHAQVPLLMGWTHDETAFGQAILDIVFGYLLGRAQPRITAEWYQKILRTVFKEHWRDVEAVYPTSEDVSENIRQIVEFTTDYYVICPNRNVARALSRQYHHQNQQQLNHQNQHQQQLNQQQQKDPTHRKFIHVYDFNFLAKFLPRFVFARCADKEVCHAMDLPYTFHSLQNWPILPRFNEHEHQISHALIDYWVDFAMGGDGGRGGHDTVDEYRHDKNTWRAKSIHKPAWHDFQSFSLDDDDDDGHESFSWLEFTRDAQVIRREGPLRPRQCALWDRLDYPF